MGTHIFGIAIINDKSLRLHFAKENVITLV